MPYYRRGAKKSESDADDHLIRKTIEIKRVSKKTQGGNRLAFTCLMAVGDGNGHIGIGHSTGRDVFSAVKKASRKAQNKMAEIPLSGEQKTIAHELDVHLGPAHVFLKPAPEGTGLRIGGSMRAIAEAVGIHNIVGKSFGTRNKKNNIDAMLKALHMLKAPEEKMSLRVRARMKNEELRISKKE